MNQRPPEEEMQSVLMDTNARTQDPSPEQMVGRASVLFVSLVEVSVPYAEHDPAQADQDRRRNRQEPHVCYLN